MIHIVKRLLRVDEPAPLPPPIVIKPRRKTAPAMDAFLVYGLLTGELARTAALWGGLVAVQLVSAVYAFRLDREPLRPLWAFPLQQVVYRQLMYLVVVRSVFTALAGVRMAWVKLRRTGELDAPALSGQASTPGGGAG